MFASVLTAVIKGEGLSKRPNSENKHNTAEIDCQKTSHIATFTTLNIL